MISDEQIIAHIEAHIANIDETIKELRPTKIVSKREVAERRLQTYLLILTRSAIRGVVALLRAKEYRSAIILGRSIFEYRIKSEYLLENRREAYRQFRLIPRRMHTESQNCPHPIVIQPLTSLTSIWTGEEPRGR